MRRRELITLIGAAAVAWPRAGSAQQQNRTPKIGVIMNYAPTDPEGTARFSALQEQLGKLGWQEGNSQIEVRWAAGKPALMLTFASEFISQPVDVIVANSTPLLSLLKRLTTTIPIVFVQIADPVGGGFVSSYARPGGNITGFTDFEASVAGKWLEVLKDVAPSITQAAVLLDPGQTNHPTFLRAIQSAAPAFKVQAVAAQARNPDEIEQALAATAGQPDRGLIVLPGPLNNTHRDLIIRLAARFRLPAVYPFRYYATDGGLLYYGVDQVDQWREAARYVGRVLHGEKPGDLPVQAPTKYELVINLKTAKALGLTVPPAILATADGVIE